VELGGLRQVDGFTCGPTSALAAAILLDPGYASALDGTPEGLAREQHRIHRAANVLWPRRLGATPPGVAAAISRHSRPLGVRYGWRVHRGRRDRLADVVAAVDCGWPVALLIGKVVPRHWLLIVEHRPAGTLHVFDPATGAVSEVAADALRSRRVPLGYPHAFSLVLPAEVGVVVVEGG
jgi:hypothetical protein